MSERRFSRALASLVLAAALLGKLLVPGGWMPVQADGHGVRIILCSGDGPLDAWLDATGKVHKGKLPSDSKGARDTCPYGALSAPADLPLVLALPAPALTGPAPQRLPEIAVAVGRGLAAPPPPATGPPHSA